ncbi:MAG: hypothetical protein CL917_11615 [Deltaproteobacteria bacterium]|nr:hypothetical protein [Deltaproteobacteria bacterium]
MRGKVGRQLSRIRHKKKTVLELGPGRISFTFDDVPQSACRDGRKILEEHDCKGSFYVCGGLTSQEGDSGPFHTRADLQTLKENGHEVASHGFDHLNYQSITLDEVRWDLEKNQSFFRELGWAEGPVDFAYPYGCVNPSVKALCGERFRSSRGIRSQVNSISCDLALLHSVPLYAEKNIQETVTKAILSAEETGGWLIFFTHGVLAQPGKFDCTPNLLRSTIEQACQSKCLVTPIAETLASLK